MDSPPLEHRARLRVAIVAPSLGILGGQAVQADRLLHGWADDPEVEAWLVPINPPPPAWLRWALGVKYLRTLVTQITYWPLLIRELRRADIVHVFSASYVSFLLAPLPAVLIARTLGRPVVLNYHSGEAPDHLQRSRVARTTLGSVSRNVVPSRFLFDVLASFGIPSRIVPNVIDRDRFRYRQRDPLRPRLLSTRNLEAPYNVACTLRAFARVQARHPEATLTMVGEGIEAHALRQLARDLRLRNVRFAGRVPPGDMWKYYEDADIYVQTPDIDNMPLSLLEAFSSGLPVVSTGVGGIPAILTDGIHGLLAPADDDEAVAAGVLQLLDDPVAARRMAEAARDATEAYCWTRVRDQWVAVYRSALPVPLPGARRVRSA